MLLLAPKRKPAGKSIATTTSPPRKSPTKTRSSTTKRTNSRSNRATNARAATTATTATTGQSLASFHPGIARTWLAAASNKMLQPQHVPPSSRRLAWWCCPHCQKQFSARIDLHVAAGGECPTCHKRPPLTAAAGSKATSAGAVSAATVVVHRCRPDNSLDTLAAANTNRIKKSVADKQYLRVQETRNLLPMLAKNYEKEASKIGPEEVLYVSPKLDGIRCVTAYDKANKRILFFSRSGTLFECCDEKIEPALRYAFELDPELVLDGELYNDSMNQATMTEVMKRSASASVSKVVQQLRDTRDSVEGGDKASADAASSASSPRKARGDGKDVVSFEQLTSAIRTTRERRTEAVAALQSKLQYHIFDLLYCREYPTTVSSPSFSVRYAFLADLLARVHAKNAQTIRTYDPAVLQLVPSLPCKKAEVAEALRTMMQLGYEGVMVRRSGAQSSAQTNTANALSSSQKRARRRVKAAAAQKGVSAGGYGYGQRSSTLLKYKLMQDDEFIIVGAVEGQGKWKGSLGAFVCTTKDRQHTFTVTPASTDGEKKAMWHNATKYKGKALTVQFQELTPDGVPRFPVGKCIRGAGNGKDWI